MPEKKKVVIAMSGGVDSSVAAALLLEQGYELIGVTMQLWDSRITEVDGEHIGCCSLTAVEDARRVAEQLGIPHYVMNFRDVFVDKVINYFKDEYLCGRTPNPCIACNRYVKFDAFLNKAMELGADYIATGHYARLEHNGEKGRFTIRRSLDQKKDQTYVLYGMTQQQLARTLMPLGNYTKEQVRKIARERGLFVANKAESQEICFVLDDDYRNFLSEAVPEIKPGPFLNLQGEVIGTHKGIPFYTIGQRRGLGVSGGERLYVVSIDQRHNTITLGPEEAIWGSDLIAKDLNLVLYDRIEEAKEVNAQIRYNAKPAPATLRLINNGQLHVHFHKPQRAITPGQAVVFYEGEYLVGGATIERVGNE